MLTKGLRILWVKVHISGGRQFYLNLPLSLYAFHELLDCVMDLLAVACFFRPKRQLSNSQPISVHTVKLLMKELINLMDSLAGSEPYDLVSAQTNNVKVTVKIK